MLGNIHIHKTLNELQDLLPDREKTFVILDRNVRHLASHFEGCPIICLEAGETRKTLSTVGQITCRLLEMGADRNAFILGVGGGITTDMAGFTAAVYKRGVKCGFVPTTLLAQADAAIGGKNGVNFNGYKNMLGTIRQPEWIYLCPQVLGTLPRREFRAGIAEVLKTFLLFNGEAYRDAVDSFALMERQGILPRRLDAIIGKCAQYKSTVVEHDEQEHGERRLLNLGHTFAHAIEKCAGGQGIMHGEAVALGLVIAAKAGIALGRTQPEFLERLIRDLRSTGLPALLEDCPQTCTLHICDLAEAIRQDKKKEGDRIHFIVPINPGRAEDLLLPLSQLEDIAHDLR